jgi:hypothetical protein
VDTLVLWTAEQYLEGLAIRGTETVWGFQSPEDEFRS